MQIVANLFRKFYYIQSMKTLQCIILASSLVMICKGYNVNVKDVVFNCQKCYQCFKCQVSVKSQVKSLWDCPLGCFEQVAVSEWLNQPVSESVSNKGIYRAVG